MTAASMVLAEPAELLAQRPIGSTSNHPREERIGSDRRGRARKTMVREEGRGREIGVGEEGVREECGGLDAKTG